MANIRSFDISSFLRKQPLFAAWREEALIRLSMAAQVRRLDRGEMVFYEDEICDTFFIVAVGQVKLFVMASNGNEKVIEIVGANGSFAEAQMLLGRPCGVNAQALGEVTLLAISRQAIDEELNCNPGFALQMMAGLSHQLLGLVADVQAYSLQSGLQRVVGYLLRQQAQPNRSDDRLSLAVSKATLASRLSITPEYFSRVLRELEQARLISVDKRDIQILDRHRLASYQTM